jgi:hypothetical protein
MTKLARSWAGASPVTRGAKVLLWFMVGDARLAPRPGPPQNSCKSLHVFSPRGEIVGPKVYARNVSRARYGVVPVVYSCCSCLLPAKRLT